MSHHRASTASTEDGRIKSNKIQIKHCSYFLRATRHAVRSQTRWLRIFTYELCYEIFYFCCRRLLRFSSETLNIKYEGCAVDSDVDLVLAVTGRYSPMPESLRLLILPRYFRCTINNNRGKATQTACPSRLNSVTNDGITQANSQCV